jgi:hypothetical protein
VAEEQFEKTPRKANRWFRAAIVFALLYGLTFSLNSFFNWIFFSAAAYSFFMSYYLLPVQPGIFQGKKRQTWSGPTQENTSTHTDPRSIESKVKRIMFIIVGGFFALFVFFFIIGILNPEIPEQQNGEELLYDESVTQSPEGLISRGNDYFNQQQYDSAEAYYDRALDLAPDNMEAVYGKGIVLYQAGKQDEAMTLFRKSYGGGYRFAWLSWVLADMHDKRGESAEAIMLYKESVSLDSSYTDSYKRLAELEPLSRDRYLKLAEKFSGN